MTADGGTNLPLEQAAAYSTPRVALGHNATNPESRNHVIHRTRHNLCLGCG